MSANEHDQAKYWKSMETTMNLIKYTRRLLLFLEGKYDWHRLVERVLQYWETWEDSKVKNTLSTRY